jgi:hypothetical protein
MPPTNPSSSRRTTKQVEEVLAALAICPGCGASLHSTIFSPVIIDGLNLLEQLDYCHECGWVGGQ